jgi:hypothetical protein
MTEAVRLLGSSGFSVESDNFSPQRHKEHKEQIKNGSLSTIEH